MINYPAALDPNLLITIYLTDLQKEALPEEIFDSLGEDYIYSVGEDPPALPNSIYFKLDAKANEARMVRVPMIKELVEAPNLGSAADPRLHEEDWVVKWFNTYYTDVSKATTNQKYGILSRDKTPYMIQEYRTIGLGKYYKQLFGKFRREALLEVYSSNLGQAPHFLPNQWSPNWYVCNCANVDQPVYNVTYAHFTHHIVHAINTAGVGQAAAGSIVYFQRLEEWARTEQLINPIDFEDGSNGYIVLLPTPTARWMKNPTVGFTTFGPLWRDMTSFDAVTKLRYPRLIGQFAGLRFVEDPRYPTLTVGGSGSAGGGGASLTAQYRGMGNADDGSSDPRDKSIGSRLVGFLLGKGALVEWMPEGFHWEFEHEMYGKYYGTGVFCGVGFEQPIYNIATPTSASAQQNGSIVLVFAQPPALL